MRGWKVVLAAVLLSGVQAPGQAVDVAGVWQGTLQLPGHDMRLEMKVQHSADGKLSANLYNVDQPGAVIAITTTSVTGLNVKLSMVTEGIEYNGKLNAGGTEMSGTFLLGGQALPLNLNRVTEAGAWAIPEAPPPVKTMPADAHPAFEVATIKPSKPEAQGEGMTFEGRSFTTRNTSLVDLLTFAYGLQQNQIVGAPAWAREDKYDVLATPDLEGQPNPSQLRAMVRTLVGDRFGFRFHDEKRDLAAYVLTVAKTGLKITAGDPKGLPGLFFQGPGVLSVRDAKLLEFAQLIETRVLDRPVVDRTGLADRFNFVLKWTPDDLQLAAMGARISPPPSAGDAPPDLFTAMQQQMGIRVDSVKVPVDVMVVDGAGKPSAN